MFSICHSLIYRQFFYEKEALLFIPLYLNIRMWWKAKNRNYLLFSYPNWHISVSNFLSLFPYKHKLFVPPPFHIAAYLTIAGPPSSIFSKLVWKAPLRKYNIAHCVVWENTTFPFPDNPYALLLWLSYSIFQNKWIRN